ncbi:MAG: hypothetical protein KDB36_09780 [Acidimicrobiales bacterium]|nr:hypothetical protein [Acidimicrobiales bacterium]
MSDAASVAAGDDAIRIVVRPRRRPPRPALLAAVTVLSGGAWAAAALAVLVRIGSIEHPAVAAAALGVGAVALVPLGLAYWRSDGAALADPLVLAGWVFWFPMFCLGGVSLALGWFRPYYLDLVADPSAALLAAQLWALVGFGALALGTALPGLVRAGSWLAGRLPAGDWPPGRTLAPAAVLTVAGLGVSAVALLTGQVGYEAATRQEVSPLPAYVQTIAVVGVALVWVDLLRRASPSRRRVVATCAVLGGVALVSTGLAESRAMLATWVLVLVLVAAVVRAPIPRRVAAGVLLAAGCALAVGAVVGSTYREQRAGLTDGAGTAPSASTAGRGEDLVAALRRTVERGPDNAAYLRDRAVQRLEAPGTLAVIAARAEELDGVDEAAGAPTVVSSTIGAFVPRLVWPSKPATGDPGAISRLYFAFEDNAFAVTPMGDLLRDLGPVAVPVGMALVGIVLRLVHTALVRAPDAGAGRVAAYVTLLARAPSWFEGPYGNVLADLVRVGLVVAVALAFVHLWVRLAERRAG